MRQLAREVTRAAEVAVFVGPDRTKVRQAVIEAGMARQQVHDFPTMHQAAEFLKREIRPNDLILLRGKAQDHMSRVYFAQLGRVKCWKSDCSIVPLCDYCPELGFEPVGAG
jgi:UDP-N-acetylmuramyl pentapeptide synthase